MRTGTAVAGAGEYLLMLPQLLEAALEGSPNLDGAAPSPAVDGDWLDKVRLPSIRTF